ncbi:MAG: sigma-70 family RNA polymerase sigma factor [Phycisphaerales bacterium]|nr:sigma-70 family RNA polymerase sigma factor [Phycisphaerales bacterium]
MSVGTPNGKLFEQVYGRLRQLAQAQMAGERDEHTLQATALVHEVYLRLAEQGASWENQRQFLAAAAGTMRRILIDHARRRAANKRGGDCVRMAFDVDEAKPTNDDKAIDLLVLDDALARLEREDPRAAQIVQLRFFGGLSIADTARMLDLSPMSVKRSWAFAQAWLRGEVLGDDL